MKIRHYGLLANRGRHQRLERARELLRVEPTTATDPRADATEARTLPRCPYCGWAALFLVRVVPPLPFKVPPAVSDSS